MSDAQQERASWLGVLSLVAIVTVMWAYYAGGPNAAWFTVGGEVVGAVWAIICVCLARGDEYR